MNACPLDKKPLFKKDLVAVSIPFRNLLNRLDIKCDYEAAGCPHVCQMHHLPSHVKVCPFNPDGEMICDQGCELTFLRRDRDSHKCIQALKELVSKQRGELADLNKRMKRSYDTAFFNRFPGDRPTLSEFIDVQDRQIEILSRQRQNLLRSRSRFESSSASRARTPPPPNISLRTSGLHHQLQAAMGPVSSSGATPASHPYTRSRLSMPVELSEVQVQVQVSRCGCLA